MQKVLYEDSLISNLVGLSGFSLGAFLVDWSAAEREVLGDLLLSVFPTQGK